MLKISLLTCPKNSKFLSKRLKFDWKFLNFNKYHRITSDNLHKNCELLKRNSILLKDKTSASSNFSEKEVFVRIRDIWWNLFNKFWKFSWQEFFFCRRIFQKKLVFLLTAFRKEDESKDMGFETRMEKDSFINGFRRLYLLTIF